MAVVHRCDVCKRLAPDGVDISASNRPKLETKILGTKVALEVHIAVNDTWNGGHICNKCLSKALLLLADRLEEDEKRRQFVNEEDE